MNTNEKLSAVETNCENCGDYMSDVEEEDFLGGCNNICDKCCDEKLSAVETNCEICGDYMTDVKDEEFEGGHEEELHNICDKCCDDEFASTLGINAEEVKDQVEAKIAEIMETDGGFYFKHYCKIMEEIVWVDIKPYSHNIIGLELRIISDKYGKDISNYIIRTTDLNKMGWHEVS